MPDVSREYVAQMCKQWNGLVLHVVNKYTHSAGRKIRCDTRDLAQAGFVGLIDAIHRFDEEREGAASFKTFAYVVIQRAVIAEADQAASVFKTGRLREAKNLTSESADRLASALRICYLEDIGNDHENLPHRRESPRHFENPAEEGVDNEDEVDYYVERLRASMTQREMDVLLARADGTSYNEIAECLNCGLAETQRFVKTTQRKAESILKGRV